MPCCACRAGGCWLLCLPVLIPVLGGWCEVMTAGSLRFTTAAPRAHRLACMCDSMPAGPRRSIPLAPWLRLRGARHLGTGGAQLSAAGACLPPCRRRWMTRHRCLSSPRQQPPCNYEACGRRSWPQRLPGRNNSWRQPQLLDIVHPQVALLAVFGTSYRRFGCNLPCPHNRPDSGSCTRHMKLWPSHMGLAAW